MREETTKQGLDIGEVSTKWKDRGKKKNTGNKNSKTG